MRWLPFALIFLLAYIEISIFIKVAAVLGVPITLLLVIISSCVGISLVRNQGIKTFIQMQQKLAAGESPAAEMIKSVSLVLAGILLLIPGFFTDFLGLLLLLPWVQKTLTLKLMPHLNIYRGGSFGGAGFGNDSFGNRHGSGPMSGGDTFDGEFQRKDDDRFTVEHRPDKNEQVANSRSNDDSFKDDK
ncbi:FxsA family protein [Yersinia pseudotuberculosis]|uniref:FxsA family protein n=1 Tax=Yersinia pseudotuberculosis TaxID=633 RepID=UPI001A9FBCAC|nr:FxsA family protein [Yersinia pseudotuberculosis]MBO1551654.1 membrane protein FxsA [Yersinia pseudotuberculosis]MBO1571801.1 membrane protein FxsA [Yersinia pseudotuberculosis]MBO1586705.1 membrane protein FxsA [Yersinia pseudotuberculosis]MBO1636251.1 membrane protein FxsA [Yersinia pseudotuberculosis]